MQGAVTYLASAKVSEQSDILGTLGIDVKLLILQTIAFLALVWLLSKFVFPKISAMLEAREKAISDGIQAARDANQKAQATEAHVEELLKKARREAKEVVAGAQKEAATMIADAEEKSKNHAAGIVARAHIDIEKEVVAAKKALHNETIDLIAAATEKVIGRTVDTAVDRRVIADALKESA